uniref:LLM class flavin-dependent oxidoreductase n=1 Tax=Candidatus Entotheonella palauensis TaxID=93172 RepID=UPI001178CA54
MAQLGMVLYHGIDNGPELKTYGRIAEDLGYDSLWVTERYFHEETFSLLGFLAAATERLRLGVGVVNPYTRHPALLAMGAATLDRISGGRIMLGLGRSERFVIQDRMGIPYTR